MRHLDHILLVQVGMFYEIYGDYVDEIASILGLRIGVHKGAEGSDHRFSRFAGFPIGSLRNHLEILLKNGKTVAICDQVKQASSDYIYRKVTRIITPGTKVDESDLDVENNFLLSVFPQLQSNKAGPKIGLAYVDVSTGEFNISTSASMKSLENDLNRIQPKEIVIPTSAISQWPEIGQIIKESLPAALVSVKPDSFFLSQDAISLLSDVVVSNDPAKAIFRSNPADALQGFKPLQAEAAGGLLSYLSETFPSARPSIRSPEEVVTDQVLQLDSISLSSLEITKTQREGNKKGSLLSILDKTKTAAGHRMLHARLKTPSTNLTEINRRLDLISIFYTDSFLTAKVSSALSDCKDIERALQRIHLDSGAPSDLSNIVRTLSRAISLKEILSAKLERLKISANSSTDRERRSLHGLFQRLGNFDSVVSKLQGLISEQADVQNKISALGVIRTGASPLLDRERDLHLELLQRQDERSKQLTSLFNSRLGPVVEIGKASEKTTERIHQIIDNTPSLSISLKRRMASTGPTKIKDEIWSVLHHEIQMKADLLLSLESELFMGACRDIKAETLAIVTMCKALAEVDIACSQASLAHQSGFSRPIMTDHPDEIHHHAQGGRHPVVEAFQLGRGNSFVINDTNLTGQNNLILLTGANMGGKSTYLRQAAITSIMAQAGLFVPCSFAKLSIVDKIFTRIGSSDDLSANQSTFMVEMKETAAILNNATKRSLVIMDEVGRGTSTLDGVALALAIIQHLVEVNGSMTIFATHYHELAAHIAKLQIPRVSFYQTACLVNDEAGSITCLHKIIPGVMSQSHGIKIAKVAGLPEKCIRDAQSFYSHLE